MLEKYSTTKDMVVEYTIIRMERYILATESKINSMEKEFIYFLMEKDMMGKLWMGLNMEMEYTSITMEMYTQENGIKIRNKVLVNLNIKINKNNMKETS